MIPVASYVLSNNSSVNIYDIIYGIEDYVVAGINNKEPKSYLIKYRYDEEATPYFKIGEIEVNLHECIMIEG